MKNPDEYEILERAHEAAGSHMMQKSPRADELIACLEGEIAKRDAIIYDERIDADVQRQELDAANANLAGLRAELDAIKAQEPVKYEFQGRDGRWCQFENQDHYDNTVEDGSWPIRALYAAPVSEAKAQGVVQWPSADEIMQMAFEEGQPADDASGYCFELEEFDLFIERLMSEVTRLNAAPVQQENN